MNNFIKKPLISLMLAIISLFSFTADKTALSAGSVSNKTAQDTAECSVTVCGEEIEIGSRLLDLIRGARSGVSTEKEDEKKVVLIAGGGIFGAKIRQKYVTVADPLEHTELKHGDRLLSINGEDISSVSDVQDLLARTKPDTAELVCERGGKNIKLSVKTKTEDGTCKLGVILKDGAAGIGTVTYIDPETGIFGGLGHGICDSESGSIIEMTEGSVTGVILGGVKKGEAGKPGELSGILTDKVSGTLYANTECGVFGKLDKLPEGAEASAIEVGRREDVHTGEATVISTVKNGTSVAYKITITDVNTESHGTKSFKIKVTDSTLTAITGGVVRGMSGSPIIQDGKLIGALTHVMIGEPTEGYGIFIENMLETADRVLPEQLKDAA